MITTFVNRKAELLEVVFLELCGKSGISMESVELRF